MSSKKRPPKKKPSAADVWFKQGQEAFAEENYALARDFYLSTLKANKRYPNIYYHLGMAFLLSGEDVLAARQFDTAENSRYTDAKHLRNGWISLGGYYLKNHREDAALKAFEHVVTLDPSIGSVWGLVGQFYVGNNQDDEALQTFEKALKLDSRDRHAWNQMGAIYKKRGDREKVIEMMESDIQNSPEHRLEALLALGAYHLEEQKVESLEKALQAFEKAVALDPGSWGLLGELYFALDRDDEALQAFEKALELDPGNRRAWNHMGTIYKKRGDREKVIEMMESDIQNSPEHRLEALLALGAYHLEEQKVESLEKALQAFEKAVALDPSREVAWHNIVYIGMFLGKYHALHGRYEAARAAYENAIAVANKGCPDMSGGAYFALALHERDFNKFEDAIAHLSKARELDFPIDANDLLLFSFAYLVIALSSDQNLEEAIRFNDQIIEMAPTNANAWGWRGSNYKYSPGMHNEAIAAYEHAMEIDPSVTPIFLKHIGDIYLWRIGQFEKAIAYYTQAIEHDLEREHFELWNERAIAYVYVKQYEKADRLFEEAMKLFPANSIIRRNARSNREVMWREVEIQRTTDQQEIARLQAEIEALKLEMERSRGLVDTMATALDAMSSQALEIRSIRQQLADIRVALEDTEADYGRALDELKEQIPEDEHQQYFYKALNTYLKRMYVRHMAIALEEAAPLDDRFDTLAQW